MRELFMALLAGDSEHGYEIKQAFESRFGDVLPAMNSGQVYSTLARLERDGLIEGSAVPYDSRGKRTYRLTEAGGAELRRWVATPVAGVRLKDEFFMKLAIATSVGLADAATLVDQQRREYLQSLRDLDAAASAGDKGVAGLLMIEGAVLHLQADIEWLDIIESRLGELEKTP
jgi:DNA-binding PadR family transcriptional regulator